MDEEPPLLPSRARYLKNRADHEAAHGIAWSNDTNAKARRHIYDAFVESYQSAHIATDQLTQSTVNDIFAQGSELARPTVSDFESACSESVWRELCPEAEFLDWLQASALALQRLAGKLNGSLAEVEDYSFRYQFDHEGYIRKVNDILLDRRINYTFVGGQIKERGAEPLHVEIIQPMEAAITSDPRFVAVEAAYKQASHSLATGQYGASITTIGSALQETFTALGVDGANLGAQFSTAKDKGLLLNIDEKLYDAYKKIGDWITANRSNRGNAHGAASAQREDAELAIHVIASLIVRLIQVDA